MTSKTVIRWGRPAQVEVNDEAGEAEFALRQVHELQAIRDARAAYIDAEASAQIAAQFPDAPSFTAEGILRQQLTEMMAALVNVDTMARPGASQAARDAADAALAPLRAKQANIVSIRGQVAGHQAAVLALAPDASIATWTAEVASPVTRDAALIAAAVARAAVIGYAPTWV